MFILILFQIAGNVVITLDTFSDVLCLRCLNALREIV